MLVRGRLEIGEYTAKNTGEVRTTYDIWADDVVNLTLRDSGQSGAPEWAQGANAAALTGASPQPTAQRAAGRPAAVGEVDELPL